MVAAPHHSRLSVPRTRVPWRASRAPSGPLQGPNQLPAAAGGVGADTTAAGTFSSVLPFFCLPPAMYPWLPLSLLAFLHGPQHHTSLSLSLSSHLIKLQPHAGPLFSALCPSPSAAHARPAPLVADVNRGYCSSLLSRQSPLSQHNSHHPPSFAQPTTRPSENDASSPPPGFL